MTNYPRANTKAAWYANAYRGSAMNPNCGVIHTTEGNSLPSYGGGATAPTYTAVPNFDRKRLDWFAHFPDEMSARALRNLAGGVETNTNNAIQVELVGTCDPGTAARWRAAGARFIYWPDAPQWALDDLAEFVAWANREHGIRIEGPRGRWKAYPASYGQTNPNRFSFDRWRRFYGWCGHQHVPENSHGDPGRLNWGYVQKKARALVSPAAKPPKAPKPPKRSPRWDALWKQADALEKSLKPKAKARRKSVQAIKNQAARWSVRH